MTTQLLTVNTEQFLLEVDHLQIYTMGGLPEVWALKELGLNNADQILRRERQGTASTIFFFENTYLELIWVEDEITFRQYATQTNMNLLSRLHWQHTGASPFGIGLRYKTYILDNFYQTSYSTFKREGSNPETAINFSAENLEAIEEPMCFTIPNNIALTTWLDQSQENHQQLMTHPLGIKKLTGVKITISTHKIATSAVSLLEDNGIITIERGIAPLLELTFDGNANNQVVDARAILPLKLRY